MTFFVLSTLVFLFFLLARELGTTIHSFLLSIQFSPSWRIHCQENRQNVLSLLWFQHAKQKTRRTKTELVKNNSTKFVLLDDKRGLGSQDVKRRILLLKLKSSKKESQKLKDKITIRQIIYLFFFQPVYLFAFFIDYFLTVYRLSELEFTSRSKKNNFARTFYNQMFIKVTH